MKPEDLSYYRAWFSDYTRSFYSGKREEQKNIYLKVRHTTEVCALTVQIAGGLSLDANKSLIAEAAALFHDLGRFPQYAGYKTFRDSISVNHGKLGAEVLLQEKVLRDLSENEQLIIISAVKFHNAMTVPSLKDMDEMLVLKMIRDADKLDIWRIFIAFCDTGPKDETASEIGLGLPDMPGYSDEVLASIFNRHTASLKSLRSLNDLKIMLMSWIYDLNFGPSVRIMAGRDYLNKLASLLPDTGDIRKAKALLAEYLERRLEN
jgi:putative nucleotidyltransferase with HDIG domain